MTSMGGIKPEIFYRSKPIFGLDIGSDSIKAIQLKSHKNHTWTVECYGMYPNTKGTIKEGVIVDTKKVAVNIDKLLSSHIVGNLSAERASLSVPISRVYTRALNLPAMNHKDLDQVVQTEVEQSFPRSLDELYIDYEIVQEDNENIEIQLVAVPREIADSYLEVCRLLKLETVVIETNIQASARLVNKIENVNAEQPFFIVDVGGRSIDVGAFDRSLRVTGTIDEGGETLTSAISKVLKIDENQAHLFKTIYGLNLSSKQDKIGKAVAPILQKVVQEIRKMDRFYQERVSHKAIGQIILTGGGANMPGISDYLTNELRIPTRVCAPWSQNIKFGKLPTPPQYELPRYLTVSGLALVSEEELKG